MARETLRIRPGVDRTETLVLNQAGVSLCDQIRFMPDVQGLGLVQKLGGWTRYYPRPLAAIIRALWAWQDANFTNILAAGCGEITPNGGSPLNVISSNALTDITPQVRSDNVAVSVSTTSGSNLVTVTDTGSSASVYDGVFVAAHISVGGLIIYGFYKPIPASANTFQLAIVDLLGNPIDATSTIVNGGTVAEFTTAIGDVQINVKLPAHGMNVGDTFPIMISTTVGGVTLVGNYVIQEVVDADNFTIFGPTEATSTQTLKINGGNARYNFYPGAGPIASGSGYGTGGYGEGGYGSGVAPSPSAGVPISSLDWTLDNWGGLLIACPTDVTFNSPYAPQRRGGPIYYWDPLANTPRAIVIPEAPVSNGGAFVAMPQRQIIAYASTSNGIQDPMLIRWCDVDNFFNWIASPLTRAGQYRLTRGSRIVAAAQGPQQIVAWTDVGVWTANYIGGQGVYAFNEVARGVDLAGRKAYGFLGNAGYWMGSQQFWQMAGNGVGILPCPIWDQVFQQLDIANAYKIRCAVNSLFNEVTWYYPTLSGGGEINAYVKANFSFQAPVWDYGTIARTAWLNQSVVGKPVGAGVNRLIYQHETSNDADGQAMTPFMRTGYFMLSEGDLLMFIDEIWPDMKWGQLGGSQNATVNMTFYVREFPNSPDQIYGPFSLTQAVQLVAPRFRGRLVSIELSSNDVGSFWRMGGNKYRGQPDGRYL